MQLLDHGRKMGIITGILVALLTVSCRQQKAPTTENTLTIYVPCGMELPLIAAQEAFEAANPGLQATVVLDNARILVRRVLEKGENPDLIVSPGLLEMEILQKHGAVGADDVHPFGRYELALFTSRANPAAIKTCQDLTRPEVKTIAIADPDQNSVGRYTREALQAMKLWEQLQPKLLLTDHPITAYKHVAREKAEASFAYRSCPLKTAPEKLAYSKVRILESVPADSYGPAYAVIAPLTASAHRETALKFVDFMLSEAGQKLLAEHDVPILKPKPAPAG